jgi:hypothetical protein
VLSVLGHFLTVSNNRARGATLGLARPPAGLLLEPRGQPELLILSII